MWFPCGASIAQVSQRGSQAKPPLHCSMVVCYALIAAASCPNRKLPPVETRRMYRTRSGQNQAPWVVSFKPKNYQVSSALLMQVPPISTNKNQNSTRHQHRQGRQDKDQPRLCSNQLVNHSAKRPKQARKPPENNSSSHKRLERLVHASASSHIDLSSVLAHFLATELLFQLVCHETFVVI